MLRKYIHLFLIILPVLICQNLKGQVNETSSFKLYPRFSFYSCEKDGEFLLHAPASMAFSTLSVELTTGNDTIAKWKGTAGGKIIRIPCHLHFDPSVLKVTARITLVSVHISYSAVTYLSILPYKPNEVKTDRLTGGLIVNGRQFFPFGFYTYSPVYKTLIEEEVVKGFNMISPYQKIVAESLPERKAYMDRCAELGMKVHYNLLSISGGGGVGSKSEGLSPEEKKELLIKEVKTFMDHPALLGWYISDEPNGMKVTPESLEEIYRTVKQTDPWHPVSIVFMAPFLASKNYANALDIVMADPYPVPDHPVTLVGDVAGQLKTEYAGRRPVWMVMQAFGGGEWWGREPTIQEIRSMTWQSIAKGACGIQYFVRQGLNYFPKSTATWSECGRMAMEVAELTPWLLSDEEPLPVVSSSPDIIVSSKLHNGRLLVMAVNKKNEPLGINVKISGVNSGKAWLLFENRSVNVVNGLIYDHLAALGTQAYMIDLKPEKPGITGLPENLIRDPGFEDGVSPGIPSACYARPGGDRGATYFLDTREHTDGNHSVRLITPSDDKSITLRFFPFRVKAGASYVISLWAKSDPEQRFSSVTTSEHTRLKGSKPQYIEVMMGDFSKARFIPDKEWRRYMTFVTVPSDTLNSFRTNLIIRMPGQGVAWIDQMKVFEEIP